MESWKGREALGDFTTTVRVIPISVLAMFIGVVVRVCGAGAVAVDRIIYQFVLFRAMEYGVGFTFGNHLGISACSCRLAGALIIGLMARYGSERIRGHGIPEAIESILINGSRIRAENGVAEADFICDFDRVGRAVWRGRADHHDRRRVRVDDRAAISSDERGAENVAGGGCGGGMSATFAAPVASVLLAVELLLFEWKPRSLIPVALASAVAAVCRRYILGFGPLFPVPEHPLFIGPNGIAGLRVGRVAGRECFRRC